MKNNNIFRVVFGVGTLIVLVVGVTYAYFAWKSSDVTISGNTGCFDIIYDKGQDIGTSDSPAALPPACTYTEGASADVTINIDSTCTTSGVASINLKSNNFTLYDGSDAFDRTDEVLKYQVVQVTTDGETETLTEVDGCSGYITDNINKSICEVDLSYTATTYRVYLYLDCETVTTSYIGSSYSGYIQTVATQNAS